MRTQKFGRSCFFFLLVCGYCFAGTATAADGPTARTLIKQAIAAQGGMKALETIKASIVATKGNISEGGVEGTFKAETFAQMPSQYRLVMSIETEGNRIPYIDVLNGDRAWNRVLDETQEVSGPMLTEMRAQAYVNYVSTLIPLVNEEGYSLTTEARQQVENAPADVVVVHKKDKPDTRLFFDAQSHLLVKIEHTRVDPNLGKNARYEEFAQDYRVVDPLAGDRKILSAAKIGPDAGTLEAFLRKQSLDVSEQEQVQTLIKAFSDDKFAVREEAKDKLIKMGPRVRGLLEEATRSTDPEVASRARECLPPLGKGPSSEVLGAAVRMLSIERDSKALEALLAYLPSAGDEAVAKEMRSALAALADSDPQARQRLTEVSKTGDPAVRKAIAALLDASRKPGAIGYRVYPAGVKFAMKGVKLRDGKKTAEWETTEVRFYHALPGTLFGKP
jgi:hypothetical protein